MKHPFTDTYIQMAKAAEEIQAMRPPFQYGDAVFAVDWDRVAFVGQLGVSNFQGLWRPHHDASESDVRAFWLPLLHQLLGMLGEPKDPHFLEDTLMEFSAIYSDGGHSLYHTRKKMNDWHEIALAVVMREKYGKVWRDGAWVKA